MDLLEVFGWMINLKSETNAICIFFHGHFNLNGIMLLSLVQSECENESSFNHLIVSNVSICVYKKTVSHSFEFIKLN